MNYIIYTLFSHILCFLNGIEYTRFIHYSWPCSFVVKGEGEGQKKKCEFINESTSNAETKTFNINFTVFLLSHALTLDLFTLTFDLMYGFNLCLTLIWPAIDRLCVSPHHTSSILSILLWRHDHSTCQSLNRQITSITITIDKHYQTMWTYYFTFTFMVGNGKILIHTCFANLSLSLIHTQLYPFLFPIIDMYVCMYICMHVCNICMCVCMYVLNE